MSGDQGREQPPRASSEWCQAAGSCVCSSVQGTPSVRGDRIVDGKLAKFVSGICLVEQPFVKDPDKSVGDLLKEAGAVRVFAFERFKLGQSEEETASE